MAVTTLSEFRDHIKRELGSPVITVELANEQLDQIIEDSIQDFTRYNYGEGLHKDYVVLNLIKDQTDYSLSGTDIEDVVDLILSVGSDGGINTLFSPQNMLLSYEAIANVSNYHLADYYTAMTALKEIMNTFGLQFRVDYIQPQSLLRVVPTPTSNLTGLMEVYKRETAINLYNHTLVKKLATARAKVLWGTILGKYTIQFPGGGTANGTEIKADGQAMEEKAFDAIRNESESPDFFVG